MDTGAIRQRLLARAYLYDDPDSYAAGVIDAMEELARAIERRPA